MLAPNLPGIYLEFARNLLGTRSSLGICSEFSRKTARTSHARNSPFYHEEGQTGSICHLCVFPCFAVLGAGQINTQDPKNSSKSVIVAHLFVCAPQKPVKTRT